MPDTAWKRVRERRKALGMNIDELADKIGKHRSTVYRYEAGESGKNDLDALVLAAEVLRTTVAYLLGTTDDPEPGVPDPDLDDIEYFQFGPWGAPKIVRLYNRADPGAQKIVMQILQANQKEENNGEEG